MVGGWGRGGGGEERGRGIWEVTGASDQLSARESERNILLLYCHQNFHFFPPNSELLFVQDELIYAPMVYTALCVMFLMRAGLGPGNRDFFGPCEKASIH
jgi:hypothetical protein